MLLFALLAAAAALALAPAGATAHSPSALPAGDQAYSTTIAARGKIFSCVAFRGRVANSDAPWFNGDGTFDMTEKAVVDGDVHWSQAAFRARTSGSSYVLSGNNLPTTHGTGVFPPAAGDDAAQYAPSLGIRATTVSYSIPLRPKVAATRACLPGGPVGIAVSGVQLFNALDAAGADANAHEVQDTCAGHPSPQEAYHYHAISGCLTKGQKAGRHSGLVGYAFDGFGIYGPRGTGGVHMTNAKLDACHGHTHRVRFHGRTQRIYHYHATDEYPYFIGCFRGTSTVRSGPPAGGPPGGPPPM